LSGEFALPLAGNIFIYLWLGLACLFCLSAIANLLRAVGGGRHFDPFELIPFGMVAFFVLILRFNLWWASSSEREMLETLDEIFAAPPRPDSTGFITTPVPGDLIIRPRHEKF